MSTVVIKSGDTAIAFTSTLVLTRNALWSLFGASVKFLLKKGSTAYSFDATVVDTRERTVKYVPGFGFPRMAGTYKQEWEVTFSDNSEVLTFPSGGSNFVKIIADLNSSQ